jgi:hypothetical protein
MNTKLTLSIDKQVIAQAKAAAAEKGMSLSALVEGYLKSMLLRKNKEPDLGDEPIIIGDTVAALRGSITPSKDFDGDYNALIETYRQEKWGNQ